MERKSDSNQQKRRVRFDESAPNKERTNKKLQSKSEMQQEKQTQEKKIRERDEKRSGKEGSEDEEERQMRTQAEKSRRKKRRLLANVDEDSADSGDGYEGEELDEKDEMNSGIKLESFNLRDEFRDGVINLSTGSVSTKNAKEDEEDEDWLKEYDQRMQDDAYVTKMERLQGKWEQDEANFDKEDAFTHAEALQLLEDASDILLWGESVSKALNRLRPKTNDKNAKTQFAKSKAQNKTDGEQSPFNKLTNAADRLLSAEKLVDIYSMTKEELLDHLEAAKAKYVKWQYKWQGEDYAHGPFTNAEMKEWADGGYFSFEEGKCIMVRRIVQGSANENYFILKENIF